MLFTVPPIVLQRLTISPPSQMQLYYGEASYFALLQLVNRDLGSKTMANHKPSVGFHHTSAGLDIFSIHQSVSATPDTREASHGPGLRDLPPVLLPYEVAEMYGDYNFPSFVPRDPVAI